MKLIPTKCTVGIPAGKFLGYIITLRGIKTCPDQIIAILNMPSTHYIREIQNLNSQVAILNRFISREADMCQPFFKKLCKPVGGKLEWTPDCKKAFPLKKVPSEPTFVDKVARREKFIRLPGGHQFLCQCRLDAGKRTCAATHLLHRKVLHDAESRYTLVEKMVLASTFEDSGITFKLIPCRSSPIFHRGPH